MVLLDLLFLRVSVLNFRYVGNRLDELWRGPTAVAFTALHKLWLDLRRIWEEKLKDQSNQLICNALK